MFEEIPDEINHNTEDDDFDLFDVQIKEPIAPNGLTDENLHTCELNTHNDECKIQVPRNISDIPVPWMQFRYFQSMFMSLALSDKKSKRSSRLDTEYVELSARAAEQAKEMIDRAKSMVAS